MRIAGESDAYRAARTALLAEELELRRHIEKVAALRRAQLFAREEAHSVREGEARLHITTRIGEGPREAGALAEEQLLRRTFAAAGYNVAETARQLGLAREHVYYYLNKYGIRRPAE